VRCFRTWEIWPWRKMEAWCEVYKFYAESRSVYFRLVSMLPENRAGCGEQCYCFCSKVGNPVNNYKWRTVKCKRHHRSKSFRRCHDCWLIFCNFYATKLKFVDANTCTERIRYSLKSLKNWRLRRLFQMSKNNTSHYTVLRIIKGLTDTQTDANFWRLQDILCKYVDN
jgi:hypothetical protein